jgi:hypothetical protein
MLRSDFKLLMEVLERCQPTAMDDPMRVEEITEYLQHFGKNTIINIPEHIDTDELDP